MEQRKLDLKLPFPGGTEHILLVDDERSVAEVMQRMLEKLGYKVTVRVCPVEALEAYRGFRDQINLVITDLTMPHMTGLELFAQLKKDSPELPVIICTGFSEHIDGTHSSAIGIAGFLNKPALMRELAEEVRTALDGCDGSA